MANIEELLYGKAFDKKVFDYIKKGNLRGVKVMLNDGTDINFKEEKSGKSLLRFSLEAEQFNIAKYLMKNGARLQPEDFVYMVEFHQRKMEKKEESRKHFQSTLEAEEKKYFVKLEKKFGKLKVQYKKMRKIIKQKDRKIKEMMELEKKSNASNHIQKFPDIELKFDKPSDKDILDAVDKNKNGIIGLIIEDSSQITLKSMEALSNTCGRIKRLVLRNISPKSGINTILICPLLEYLDITNSPGVSFIKGYSTDYENYRLSHLVLEKCNKIDIPFDLNRTITRLEVQFCEHFDDDEVEIEEGPNWENLEHLNLQHTKITDGSLRSLAEYSQNLVSLNIGSNKVSDVGIKYLVEYMGGLERLKELDVSNCPQVTQIHEFPLDLVALNISGNRNLFRKNELDAIKELANFRTLEVLVISNLSLKEGHLSYLCRSLNNLKVLDVSWSPIFDNWCLEAIAKDMPKGLEVLNISKSKKVDDFGVLGMLKHSKVKLKKLICLKMMDRFTIKSVTKVEEKWKDCEVVHDLK